MVLDSLQELYPELSAIKVKLQGNVTVNLFEAVCIGSYAITHQSGYYDSFSITFLDSTRLTTDIHNKVQEFLYRDLGQTNELYFDTFSDTEDNTVGIELCWTSKYKIDTEEYTKDIEADVERTFSYTQQYAQDYSKYKLEVCYKKY
jgi:hypothetical protein